MASSSQDQSTTTTDNSTPPSVSTGKRRFWLRLVITFVIVILLTALILALLTHFKILPQRWFMPLLTSLVPILGAVGTFIKTMLTDKDFQQAVKKWIVGRLSGDSNGSANDGQNPAPQSGVTINFSPTTTITNTNTATATLVDNTQQAQPQLVSPAVPPSTEGSATASTPLADSSASIFFPNMRLTDPKEFYGRNLDRAQLLNRTRNGGSTSIVGPPRSGKTWLVTYLRLFAAEQLGPNFHIGYLSAVLPSCATRAGFTREALKALGHPLSILPASPELALLEDFVREMRAQNRIPVLCIDEFEYMTHYPAEFDPQFFTGLRAITEIGLGLIVLSNEPLIDLMSQSTRTTSPFFNVFLQLRLAPFRRAEAEQFVQEKETQAQFSKQERAYMLAYAQSEKEQFPPLRLQLVGEMLLSEKRAATSTNQQHYRPDDPEYWQAFKERVDAAYRGMVRQ